MGKLNGLNPIKNSGIVGKTIILKNGNQDDVTIGTVIELWHHEEDTGVDIILDTPSGLRTYVISINYLAILIEEYK